MYTHILSSSFPVLLCFILSLCSVLVVCVGDIVERRPGTDDGWLFFCCCICLPTKENINTIQTNIFFNFRKTLLVQFSRNLSDKPICKYDIAVCLKKVLFYCIIKNLLLLNQCHFLQTILQDQYSELLCYWN